MTGNRITILIVGAVIIAVGAYALLTLDPPTDQAATQQADDQTASAADGQEVNITPEEADVVITRTADGYEPEDVTIARGDTVLWKNESGEHHWPASDVHPTHRIYSAFDPDRPIASGEDWAFQFERVGEWKFHDHLRANFTGTVRVTE